MIYHIATRTDWDTSLATGIYITDSLHREGFIHCSTHEQLAATAVRFFAGRDDLVLLQIDPTRLDVDLRYEEGEPGILFPHLYGPLDLSAVIAAHPFQVAPPPGS
ncbi:hypothetical protein OSCT_1662 [Oscillochloris trichoides DG-6]|uniref:DUF952 domain-containing protein n=1 Tax=Oscillochloris trichoides DG-6 TaxID=765420 RepID=E1IEB1_9CHLR|nr:DUF952 domain-containing protein [Oscillochloris trichoides]EFO80437.1 hypothetical protein OSCT_1662 [Oscillochloris trichoides DG-6]